MEQHRFGDKDPFGGKAAFEDDLRAVSKHVRACPMIGGRQRYTWAWVCFPYDLEFQIELSRFPVDALAYHDACDSYEALGGASFIEFWNGEIGCCGLGSGAPDHESNCQDRD